MLSADSRKRGRVNKASDRKPEAGTESARRWELGRRFAEGSKDIPAAA